MKIIKSDYSKNHYRVVKIFAYLPKLIYIAFGSDRGKKLVWLKEYYELQLDSYWGKGWMRMEQSFNQHEWDFKWSEDYLKLSQQSSEEKERRKAKYPPKYKNSKESTSC